MAATAHTVNTDQRRMAPAFKATGTNQYSFAVPTDAGVALPGYWMLFAMNGAGVPSVAKVVRVGLHA